MNLAFARNNYTQVKSETLTNRRDAYEAVKFAMFQAIESMEILQSDAQVSEKEFHYQKSLTCIYFLQKCLNFEDGGDLAKNLFKVYEYCRQNILGVKLIDEKNINISVPTTDLSSPITYMQTIADGWDGIGDESLSPQI